jgi:putative nucleotidyltransferase with HDIG domain
MKKTIDVAELAIGMYVSELDRPWVGTPFLFQGFEITSDEEIGKLRALCKTVVIDTEQSHQPAAKSTPRPADMRAPAQPVIGRHIVFAEAQQALNDNHHKPLYPDRTTLEEELVRAREVDRETRNLVYTILDDVKLGKPFATEPARRAVGQIVESILHNPDAMVWLTHLKEKHQYTAMHSMRVCVLSLALGRHLELPRERLEVLGMGALFHDIGKIRVSNELLDKPGRLAPDEYNVMKNHVTWGVDILRDAKNFPAEALQIVGSHHERYSGEGYIQGLKGDEIGEFGLIGAIADAYDALTSDRAYRSGLSAYDALKILHEGKQTIFHPWLVEQFIQCIGIFPIGSIVELNTGDVGVVITVNRARRLKPRVALVLNREKKPVTAPAFVDLMTTPRDANGQVIEIKGVLPAGAFGINPTQYMPAKS